MLAQETGRLQDIRPRYPEEAVRGMRVQHGRQTCKETWRRVVWSWASSWVSKLEFPLPNVGMRLPSVALNIK